MQFKTKSIFVLSFLLIALLSLAGNGFAEDPKVEVTVLEAKVRKEPTLESEIMAIVQKGDIITAQGKLEEWVKVVLPPDEGGGLFSGYLLDSEIKLLEEEWPEEQPLKLPQDQEQVQTPRTSRMEFGVRIMGGANYLYGQNDINDHISGTYDYWSDYLQENVCGKLKLLQFGIETQAEFYLKIRPNIGVGLGIGYIQANKNSSVKRPQYTEKISPKITAVPLTLSLHLEIPASHSLKIVARVGVGYYYGSVSWESNQSDYYDDNRQITYSWKAKSETNGYHGDLGFEWNLTKKVALVFLISGRSAEFKNLQGDLIVEDEDPQGTSENTYKGMFLWSYDMEYNDKIYRSMGFWEEDPTSLKNSRRAEISLNRISFQIGINIRLDNKRE